MSRERDRGENLKELLKFSLKKRRPRRSTSLQVHKRLLQREKGTGQSYLPIRERLGYINRLNLQLERFRPDVMKLLGQIDGRNA